MKRCMFVDESPLIRKVAKRILGSSDLVMIEAGTGDEAIGMCEAEMPDFIVVDAALTDMHPEEFIRRVRSLQSPIKPQIAICLTEVDIPTIMRSKRAGAQGYILKPFNRSQLLDRFRNLQAAAAA